MSKNRTIEKIKNISRSYPVGHVFKPGTAEYDLIVSVAQQCGTSFQKLLGRSSLQIKTALQTSVYSTAPYRAIIVTAESESNPGTVTELPLTAGIMKRSLESKGDTKSEGDAHREKVLTVMRLLIKPQIDRFRSNWRKRVNDARLEGDLQLYAELIVCPLTKKDLSKVQNIHIDHKVPFSHIAKEFLGSNNIDPYVVPIIMGRNKRFANDEYNKLWVDYHEEHAELQVVEAKANIAKSNTIDSRTRAELNAKVRDRWRTG